MDAARVVPELEIHPLTLDRWNDLEALFGRSGASGGGWCKQQLQHLNAKLQRSAKTQRKTRKNGQVVICCLVLSGFSGQMDKQ